MFIPKNSTLVDKRTNQEVITITDTSSDKEFVAVHVPNTNRSYVLSLLDADTSKVPYTPALSRSHYEKNKTHQNI